MIEEEKTIHKEYIFHGHVITVRKDDAETSTRQKVYREVVEHPGGVAIALEDDEGKYYVVEQYRYAQEKVLIEFPAGKKEIGEDAFLTAQREIQEETGFEGKDFQYMGQIVPTAAYDTEVIDLYYAKQGIYVGQHLDEDENLNVYKLSLEEIIDKIMTNEITDAKTIALAFKIKEMKKRNS